MSATRTTLETVLGDLEQESAALQALVAPLDEAGWRTDTAAPGWDIAHHIAHLAWTDEAAVRSATTDTRAWEAIVGDATRDPSGFVDAAAHRGARACGAELLDRWVAARAALAAALTGFPAGEKMPWFGPPMSPTSMATARYMETWAHGRDVADALGATLPVTDRIRHLVHLGVRTRNFAFSVHGLQPPAEEFRVELVGPGGDTWCYGPDRAAQSVRGTAYHFALLVTQRRHRSDLDLTAQGTDADRWLDIAQVFAGPPGRGRPPTGSAP